MRSQCATFFPITAPCTSAVHEPIPLSLVEHRVGRSLPGVDAFLLSRPVGDRRHRGRVQGVEVRVSRRRRDRQEHAIRGRRGSGALRPRRVELLVEEIRLVTAVDRVDCVVDRAFDHRDPSGLAVSRRPEQDGLRLRDGIPIGDDVGIERGARRDHRPLCRCLRPGGRNGRQRDRHRKRDDHGMSGFHASSFREIRLSKPILGPVRFRAVSDEQQLSASRPKP